MSWPSPEEQLARTEEALTIITRLLAGETVDFVGRFFRTKGAVLHSRSKRRRPATGARGTQVDRHHTADVADPAEIHRNGKDEVPDALFICSSDPQTHVTRIKAIELSGRTSSS